MLDKLLRLVVVLLVASLVAIAVTRYWQPTRNILSGSTDGSIEFGDDTVNRAAANAMVKPIEAKDDAEADETTGEAEAAPPKYKALELLRPPEHLRANLEQASSDMKDACNLPYYSIVGKEVAFSPETHRLIASHIIITPGVTAPEDVEPHWLSKTLLDSLDCSYNVSTWQRLLYPPLKEFLHYVAALRAPNTSVDEYIRTAIALDGGACKFGQITPTGLVQNILLGKYLGHLFAEKTGLVTRNESYKVYIRALDEQSTFMAALATGFGFFKRGGLDLRYLKVRPTKSEWFCADRWNMSCECGPADDMTEDVWHNVDLAMQRFNAPDAILANYLRWSILLDRMKIEPHHFFPQFHNILSEYCAEVEYPCMEYPDDESESEEEEVVEEEEEVIVEEVVKKPSSTKLRAEPPAQAGNAAAGANAQAEPAKVEPPKAEPPKVEPPKAEPPKVEPPKAEPPKVEPPKVEPPKVEPPKVEPPKAEPPKVEPPKAEPPKVEPPKVEPPKVEPPKVEPPKAEPPKVEPPKVEPPKVEPPKVEPPKVEPPKVEPPKVEPPKVEPPKAEPPKVEPPKVEPPKAEPPKVEPPKAEPPKVEPVKVEAPKAEPPKVELKQEATEGGANVNEAKDVKEETSEVKSEKAERKRGKCMPILPIDYKVGFDAYNFLNNDFNTNRYMLAADTLRVYPFLLELISRFDLAEQKVRNNSEEYLKVSMTFAKPQFLTALKRALGINMDGRMTGFASHLSFELYETTKRNPGEILMRIVDNGHPVTMAANKVCEKTYQTMCQLQRFREYLVTQLLTNNVGISDYKRACRRQPARPKKHYDEL